MNLVVELLGVSNELLRQLSTLFLGQRSVLLTAVLLGGGLPQILLNLVPAGPLLALFHVCFTCVQGGVQVAEGLSHRLNAFVVQACRGVQCLRFFHLAGGVQLSELLSLSLQRLHLVLDVGGVLGDSGITQSLLIGGDSRRVLILGHGEITGDTVTNHAGLARGLVAALAQFHGQVAAEVRTDVLHLGDNAQTVRAKHIELVDLSALILDLESHLASLRSGHRELAGGVGCGHSNDAVGSRSARSGGRGRSLGIGGAAGQRERTNRQQCTGGGESLTHWFSLCMVP